MSRESLSFDARQDQWDGSQRQFRQHHGRGEVRVWTIEVRAGRVHTTHGQLGGAMQSTDYVGKAKNVGQSNALTPEQDAFLEAKRDIRKKWLFEGYDEYEGNKNIDHRHEDLSIPHMLTNLPSSFCLYKPENNLDDQKKLLAKAAKGQVWYTLKRDGMAYWLVVDHHRNVRMYSRKGILWNANEMPELQDDGTVTGIEWSVRFPHLIEAVRRMDLPPNTMLAGELVMTRDGRDDFRHVASVTKSLTKEALEKQAANGYLSYYWWDTPFYNGLDLVKTHAVRARYDIIHHHVGTGDAHVKQWIEPILMSQFADPAAAAAYAVEQKIEGFVVVDPDGLYGDKGWNLKGKPDRPGHSCAKLKPRQEDDFIAVWDPDKSDKKGSHGAWGTGKHEPGKTVKLPDGSSVVHGGVGALGLYQYNEKKELVFISKVSSGMDFSFQARLRKDSFPFVCQVEYLERTYKSDGEDTNALRHPTFLRLREDKKPEECINEQL